MKFKPMLAKQVEDFASIRYPIYASHKIDGVRAIFYNGALLSRSLKSIKNKHLYTKYKEVLDFTEKYNCIIEAEFASLELGFNKVSGIVRSSDQDVSGIDLYVFDYLPLDETQRLTFTQRYAALRAAGTRLDKIDVLQQTIVHDAKHLAKEVNSAYHHGFEGLVLKAPLGYYKFNRSTLREGLMLKIKPWITWEAQIIGFVERQMSVGEHSINELGYSVTSKKKEDMRPVGSASSFIIDWYGEELKVGIALPHDECRTIWEQQETFLDRWIEFKGMMYGSKDLPRHAIFTRFRLDLDDNRKE